MDKLIIKLVNSEIRLERTWLNTLIVDVRGPRGGSYAYFALNKDELKKLDEFIRPLLGV